jgi:hypothetical protein
MKARGSPGIGGASTRRAGRITLAGCVLSVALCLGGAAAAWWLNGHVATALLDAAEQLQRLSSV